MSYRILAQHRGLDKETEICRVESKLSAQRIAEGLAAETYSEKLPDKTRARRVKRYLSVWVQEVAT